MAQDGTKPTEKDRNAEHWNYKPTLRRDVSAQKLDGVVARDVEVGRVGDVRVGEDGRTRR